MLIGATPPLPIANRWKTHSSTQAVIMTFWESRFQVDLGNSELTVQKIALSERLLSRPTAGNFGWEEPFSVSEVSKRQRIDVRLSAATVLG